MISLFHSRLNLDACSLDNDNTNDNNDTNDLTIT